MKNEEQKNYVYRELLKSAADINTGRIYPASIVKEAAKRVIEIAAIESKIAH